MEKNTRYTPLEWGFGVAVGVIAGFGASFAVGSVLLAIWEYLT